MRCERLTLGDDPLELAARIRQLAPNAESVRGAVAEIVERVGREGDSAVLEYTRQFDGAGGEPKPLRVQDAEIDAALARLDPAVRQGLTQAAEHIRQVAELAGEASGSEARMGSHTVMLSTLPVGRAAVYVPGGRAPYPSTVLMGVVPARCAGVEEVIVCSPPGPGGDIDPVVLAACRVAGASAVYRMGGAQAIAALAYGTESLARVDVIVGPGNLFVQEAKRQVSAEVGIDSFAGPSDLVVIADGEGDVELIALDLLAQAEHGPGTIVIALSPSIELLDGVEEQLLAAPDTGAVAALVKLASAREALAVSEAFAPEHLQLLGAEAESLADEVRRAGCVFVGEAAGTAFGDYIAGSNHILPTSGTARFASGVSPLQFRRTMARVMISDPDALAPLGAAIARAEGFELHARSMEARIRQNRRDE